MYKKATFLLSLALVFIFVMVSLLPTSSFAVDDKILKCQDSGGVWQDSTGDNVRCVCPTGYSPDTEGTCVAESSNDNPDLASDEDGGKIMAYLQNGVNLLTALAGLAITASVIIGGIQYSTSGGNPQASAAAKKRIGNAFLALLALVFLYTFLQWIVPGGIFGR